MSLAIVILFLWGSLLFYIVTGGADFGAGIVELFSKKANKRVIREMMHKATAPIWEADHMWLVLAVVILFVAFPVVYSTISSFFFIPLTVMLMGIVGRGTSYAFRNSGAGIRWLQGVDNWIYVISSLVVPMFLGMTGAGFFAGKVDPAAVRFSDLYVYNWLNWFSVAAGLFTVMLCGFLASLYAIGYTGNGQDRYKLIPQAIATNIGMVVFVIAGFEAARIEQIPLWDWVFGDVYGAFAAAPALLANILLWLMIFFRKTRGIRLLAAFEVFAFQLVVLWNRYPSIIMPKHGIRFQINSAQVDNKTINALAFTLVIGGAVILPALGYLVKRFEWTDEKA